eukprot:g2494.t2
MSKVRQNDAIYAAVSGTEKMNSERTVRSVYVDFDDTISNGLTVALQLKAVTRGAARLLDHEDHGKKFAMERAKLIKEMTGLYESEAADLIQRILQNHSTESYSENAINEAMKLCEKFDDRWVKKVISSNVFGGVTRKDFLSLAPTTPLREEALSTLSSFQDSAMEVSILSINWSAEWIQNAIGDRSNVITNGDHAPQENIKIYCNEMVYGDDGVSTGNVTRVMWSGQEKAKLLQQLLSEKTDPDDGLTVFIGDSYYDIQPLLMVDIGIIIGENKDMYRFCDAFGIQIQPLLKESYLKPSTSSKKFYKLNCFE